MRHCKLSYATDPHIQPQIAQQRQDWCFLRFCLRVFWKFRFFAFAGFLVCFFCWLRFSLPRWSTNSNLKHNQGHVRHNCALANNGSRFYLASKRATKMFLVSSNLFCSVFLCLLVFWVFWVASLLKQNQDVPSFPIFFGFRFVFAGFLGFLGCLFSETQPRCSSFSRFVLVSLLFCVCWFSGFSGSLLYWSTIIFFRFPNHFSFPLFFVFAGSLPCWNTTNMFLVFHIFWFPFLFLLVFWVFWVVFLLKHNQDALSFFRNYFSSLFCLLAFWVFCVASLLGCTSFRFGEETVFWVCSISYWFRIPS